MTRPNFTPRWVLEKLTAHVIGAPAADVSDPCVGTGDWYLMAVLSDAGHANQPTRSASESR